MNEILCLAIGFIGGVLLAAWRNRRERMEMMRNHDDVMQIAKIELAQKEQEIDALEQENNKLRYYLNKGNDYTDKD